MTMIGLRVSPDEGVELLTDSIWYTTRVAVHGYRPKMEVLPDLDAVLTNQGNSEVGRRAKDTVRWLLDHQEMTFDELAGLMPELLEAARAHVNEENREKVGSNQILLAGYSPNEERFMGWRYLSDDAYAQTPVDGMFLTPTPFRYRPDRWEADNLEAEVSKDAHRLRGFLAKWRAAQPVPRPSRADQWWSLACEVWESRSAQPFGRTPVGGSVHLTSVVRGASTIVKLGELAVTDEDRALMFSGTLHPEGQWAPCGFGCDRGSDPYVECCGNVLLDQPCECDSGKLFRDCHLVERPA